MAPSARHKGVLKFPRSQPTVLRHKALHGLATGIPGQDVVARGILASMATVGHPGAICQLVGDVISQF